MALSWLFAAWAASVWRGARPIDPVAFTVGPVQVRWYGLLIAAAFLPGWWLARADLRGSGIRPDQLADATLWAIPLGLAGARLGYVVQNLGYFARHPQEVWQTWQGGLSIHGALAGVAVAVALFARARRVSAVALADVAAPSVLLGQAIGRWGNFFNGELLGYPTDVPWGIYVPPHLRPPGLEGAAFYHPAFLYESVLNGLGAAGLVAWRRRRHRRGEVAALYVAVYGLNRWLVEWVRMGARWLWGMSLAQWVSLGLMVLGLAWWAALRRAERRGRPAGHGPGQVAGSGRQTVDRERSTGWA